MASDETTMKAVHLMYDDGGDEDEEFYVASGLRRLSHLSIESSDGDEADVEMSDDDNDKSTPTKNNSMITNSVDDDDCSMNGGFPSSLPGTPERAGEWAGGGGWARRRWLERAWEMKRCSSSEQQCRVLVRPRGPDSGSICMYMDEVKACRELGLELPSDWTVEIPCGFSVVDTSSGGNSPIANWRISSPGDNPKDVKARLKVWAQAVALASASSLTG